jgi:hypothetical protein
MANTIRIRRSSVASAVPTTSQLALGELAINTNDGKLFLKRDNGTESIVEVGAGGGAGATGAAPKALTIINPTSSENAVLFFTTTSVTLSQIRSTVKGTSPSITFSIRYGTDISATGTEVVTGGITCTNTTTGVSTTSFNNATVPINSFVWLTTSASSGTVTQLAVSLLF